MPVPVLLAGKMPAPQEIFGDFISWKSLRELHKKDELLAAALRYPILWDGQDARPCIISGQDARTTRNFWGFYFLEVLKRTPQKR